ncbi:HDL446Wp [Eremothecium sinecaudum]|uniref:Peptidyl-tRNA hydrolase n=1 Tax=Eremothecium sinecaudum TaxID=45286 RepID=A0A109UZH2_9SACH|nr:HDL446Wp [Eremothecium sinecaudum]AMD20298.1 HDL446Wp [Eremothecium sinecaudum]
MILLASIKVTSSRLRAARRISFCITGLGNPEPEYALTRHNAGLLLLDLIKQTYVSKSAWQSSNIRRVNAHYCKNHELDLMLLRSDGQYINCSGPNIVPIWKKLPPKCSHVVFHDDIRLPLGKLRLRTPGTSCGGHNGLRSLAGLAREEYPYHVLSIGIGRPAKGDIPSYVLGRFSSLELSTIRENVLPDALKILRKNWPEYLDRR